MRATCDSGEPALSTVGISTKLEPGELAVPADWLVQILAAMFPDSILESISSTDELAGARLGRDEIAFCDFVQPERSGPAK